MQVDVTTRLGSLAMATPTGLPIFDRVLGGGIRTGAMLSITGPPGIGKTAFALNLAYMAARSKAAVVFASATLDETEVVARLAARALHREYEDLPTSYGDIWSGEAWQVPTTRSALSGAVETVAKKVGSQLFLYRPEPFESTRSLRRALSELWTRHERVMLVVDGVEVISATGPDDEAARAINSSNEGRIVIACQELRRVAEEGAAVVITVQPRHSELASPAATFSAELRALESSGVPLSERTLALGARPLDLVIRKNQIGPTGIVPLRFIAGAATFEERAP